jgi:MerR family copper efflux transcriptional regulator
MRISELAKRTGVTPHALRHYERLGLLVPARTAGGYRDYAESSRREVIFIAMSRRVGFSLAEIAERLPLYRNGRLSHDDMVQALQERIEAIDAEMARLRAVRAEVVDHIGWMREQKKLHQARQREQARRKPWPRIKEKT